MSHQSDGFWEVAQEQSDSRIFGKIHYRFDREAGLKIGSATAESVHANFRSRNRWDW